VYSSSRKFCPDNFWPVEHSFDLQNLIKMYAKQKSEDIDKSPEIRIINSIPFIIPFNDRILIFREFTRVDDESFRFFYQPPKLIPIRRDHLYEDALERINPLGSELRKKVHIGFISEIGHQESGIDGGGLFKEFFTEFMKAALDENRGLFVQNSAHLLYPNPSQFATEREQLEQYSFIGKMVGKGILEGILLDISFASFFLAKWLGRSSYLEELPSLDSELYRNLMFLKNYDGNVEDLALNFTLVTSEFGQNRVIELRANGKNISVTEQNRIQYIYAVSNYKLNLQIRKQTFAFVSGLSQVIDLDMLKMFSQNELHSLVSGVNIRIDIDDLKKHTIYSGPYDENHPAIIMFWKILEEFDDEDQKKFLRFATGCSRPPLLGFQQLEPKFGIRHPGEDIERLPTASTCFNLLKLPPYTNKQLMTEKLLYSINAASGFEMS
jgi:ubiquitin-protein ligase E3 C